MRVTVAMLLRTGPRVSGYIGLPAGDVALIGAGPWLHVPVGKLREDRYLPLHPQLVTLIDEYRDAYVPPGHPLLLPRRASAFGRRAPRLRFLDRGEQLRGLGVREAQEPPPWAR